VAADMTSPANLFDLTGRVALVTGASRGIGRAIALGFARAGAQVVVAARDEAALISVVREIETRGGRAAPAAFDLADATTHERPLRAALDVFGHLDILVNNAAILRPHRIERITAEELDLLHRTNTAGPLLLARAAFSHLARERRGVVVNITAVAGHAPMVGLGAYAASKAALLSFTRTMAKEWTPQGVRVNALTPGTVATDMILPRDAERRARFEAEMAAQSLFGRIAQPDEMVGPALFLASDASSFMTGQVLVVDGGLLA